MKGLLFKEFFTAKKYLQSLAVLLFLYIGLSLYWQNISFLTGICAMLSIMIGFSIFSYDTYANWDAYALCLPVGRKTVVRSRYLFSLLCLLASLAFALFFGGLLLLYTHESFSLLLQNLLAITTVCLVLLAIILPIGYRFGAEKGRVYLMISLVVILIIYIWLYRIFSLFVLELSGSLTLIFASLFLPAALLLLYGSYCLSCRIYEKKEF